MDYQGAPDCQIHQISIRPDTHTFTDPVRQERWELDRLPVQFRTSRSICSKVAYEVEVDGNDGTDLIKYAFSLLPEGGLFDVVEWSSPQRLGSDQCVRSGCLPLALSRYKSYECMSHISLASCVIGMVRIHTTGEATRLPTYDALRILN